MDYLHPAMQQAMRGHIPPILRAQPNNLKAPPCPVGYVEFHWQDLSDTLVCHIEAEAAEPSTRDEPGDPGLFELAAAYVRGVNVIDLLSQMVIARSEAEAWAQLKAGNAP